MTTLIVPAAGLSTRYGLKKPKYLLQHPTGSPMIAAGLEGLSGVFEDILVVALEEHLAEINTDYLIDEISSKAKSNCSILTLPKRTSSMVETISLGIEKLGMNKRFAVKDTDNFIGVENSEFSSPDTDGFVASADLANFPKVKAFNKSFVVTDDNGFVSGVVEKEIVSNHINTGFVGFESTSVFMSAALQMQGTTELYVSSVISYLISKGAVFRRIEVDRYEDWGTIDEWAEYRKQWKTLIVDLDGVLLQNADPLSRTRSWSTFSPIQENLEALLALQSSGKVRFVFSTSRSEIYREALRNNLSACGFVDFELLTGLLHAQRVLINDFAPTNPFPSAVAVNLPRNSSSLGDYLK